MNELPVSWRLFKAACIIQMILVALTLVLSFAGIFYGADLGWRILESTAYGTILVFLYQGFSILNDNYPDQPLLEGQKRQFNFLFLFNFLLISFLFGKVVIQWRYSYSMVTQLTMTSKGYLIVLLPLIIAVLIFVLHLVYLFGMYRLRILLYENNQRNIENNFPGEK
jgi:hypothetical protein